MSLQHTSFKNKIHMVLALLGIIPYLLVGYIFIKFHFPLTQSISLLAATILAFHLAGFYILRRFSDELLSLVHQSSLDSEIAHSLHPLKIHKHDTSEVVSIKNTFNALLRQLEYAQNKFHTVTIGLLRESRKNSQEYERRLSGIRPYVDKRVIQQIMHNLDQPTHELQGESRRVSVLFADICAFTKVSEQLSPDEVVEMLNDFFNVAVDIIYQYNGTVDKFIGDAIMATFGLATPLHQVSVDAICAGLELQDAAKRLAITRKREEKKTFKIRVGINTGQVIAGDIGSLDRMDYTVIGDTVNVASRMSDHADAGGVLISDATHSSCKGYFKVEPKGHIQVKNRVQPIEAFAVIEKNERMFQQHDVFLTTGNTTIRNFSRLR